MLKDVIWIILLTFLPFLELRASIPYGILVLKKNFILVFIICVIANILLGFVLYPFIDFIIKTLTKIELINKIYQRYIINIQNKVKKYIEKYGELGLAVFIGIPLPGSGVYSGSIAAYLLGFKYKKFIISNIIGVLIAGIIVTIAALSSSEVFAIFIKTIQ